MRGEPNNFDALRLLGALLVLVNHSMELSGDQPYGFLGQAISTLGVKIFFAMSGYLITRSWMRDPHPGRFALRRAQRILPALFVVVAVSAMVIGPFFTSLDLRSYLMHPQLLRYFGNLVFYVSYALPGVFTANPLPHATNGSLWTLPVEIAMYAMVPVLVLAARRRGLLFGLLFALALGLSMAFSLLRPAPLVVAGTEFWTASTLAPCFLGGAAVAAFRLERFLDWRLGLPGIALLQWGIGWLGPWHEAVLALLLPYAALAVAREKWQVISAVGRFGDFSYGLYLWAFPIQQAVVVLAGPEIGGWGNVAWTLPATLVMAVLSWHLVEKRALGMAPRLGRPMSDAAAVLSVARG